MDHDYDENHGRDENEQPSKAFFSKEGTLALIEAYKQLEGEMNNNKTASHHVWKKIRTQMHSLGYNYTEKQLKDRFNYVKRCWKAKKDERNTTGAGTSATPPFFEEMDELLGDKPNVTPVSECSTSGGFKRTTFDNRKRSSSTTTTTTTDSDDADDPQPIETPSPQLKRRRRNYDDDLLRCHQQTTSAILNVLNKIVEKL